MRVIRLTIEQLRRLSKTMASVGETCDYTEVAIDALEKREKYRWHDLRKDPNDLPEEGTVVNILYGENKEYDSARYECSLFPNEHCWTNDLCWFNDVIAWKYIEPFEEVDE